MILQTLRSGNLSLIHPYDLDLARLSSRVVKRNIINALSYNEQNGNRAIIVVFQSTVVVKIGITKFLVYVCIERDFKHYFKYGFITLCYMDTNVSR